MRITSSDSLAFGLIIVCSALVPALTIAEESSELQIKEISRSTGGLDNGTTHVVTFVARDSPSKDAKGKKFPGHAYIVWETLDRNANQSKVDQREAWGFYPPSSGEDFSKVEYKGSVQQESEAGPDTNLDVCRFRVIVTPEAYQHSRQAIEVWNQKEHEYDLFTQNCVSFADDVARSIGVSPPQSAAWELPSSYIRELMRLND